MILIQFRCLHLVKLNYYLIITVFANLCSKLIKYRVSAKQALINQLQDKPALMHCLIVN